MHEKGHSAKECRGRMRCSECSGRHVSAMCDPAWTPQKARETESGAVDVTSVLASERKPPGDATILLQTFRCWAVANGGCVYIRGVIDGGSQQTFIRKDVADKLHLPVVDTITLTLNTFGDSAPTPKRQQCHVVELRLRSQFSPAEHPLRATVVPFICRDIVHTPANLELVNDIRGDGGFIADEVLFPDVPSHDGIAILLGSDQIWNLVTGKIRRSSSADHLVGVATKLGWTFQGPTSLNCTLPATANALTCVLRVGTSDVEADASLRNMWELEGIGIMDAHSSKNDTIDTVCRNFVDTITKKDGRYVVAFPWKTTAPYLPDNRNVAEQRLRTLARRLRREDALEAYDHTIRTYLTDGHAERAPAGHTEAEHLYYMPHRAVLRQDATSTKMRIVFDASSHEPRLPSLNDCLESGPKMNCDLVPTLLRFACTVSLSPPTSRRPSCRWPCEMRTETLFDFCGISVRLHRATHHHLSRNGE